MAARKIGHYCQDDFIVFADDDFFDVVHDLIGDGRHHGIHRLALRRGTNLVAAPRVRASGGDRIIGPALGAFDWLTRQGKILFKRVAAIDAGDFLHVRLTGLSHRESGGSKQISPLPPLF